MSYPLHQFDNITQCHKYKVEVVLAHHTDILWALNVLPNRHPMSDTQRTPMTDTETRRRADAPAHNWPPMCWLWFDPISTADTRHGAQKGRRDWF